MRGKKDITVAMRQARIAPMPTSLFNRVDALREKANAQKARDKSLADSTIEGELDARQP